MSMGIESDRAAERLVQALCDASLSAWREAALRVATDPAESLAATALERVIRSADLVRLWDLEDDLESALFRLTTNEASGIVHGGRERQCMCAVTRRAVEALVCRALLAPDACRVLTEPLLALVPEGDVSPP